MFSDFRKAREAPKELNVLPVMNLMVTLIPFLLLGAAFYKIAVIPATLPSHDASAESSDPPPSDEIITLNLIIKADVIQLSATSPTVAPEALEPLKARLPVTAQGDDLARLTLAVARFKRGYPKSDTVLVLPDDEVPYQRLVQILDAVREQTLKDAKGQPAQRLLFPVSVFSQRIEEEPDGGGDDAGVGEGDGGQE